MLSDLKKYQDLLYECLKKHHLTISSSESFTGGLFASTLVSISGISEFFVGSAVTYSAQAKHDVINVSQETLKTYGAISKECAQEMCLGTKKLFKTDIAISFTGNAGPTGDENKKVGLAYIGIMIKDEIVVKEYNFKGDRNQIRLNAVIEAMKAIIDMLN